MGGTSHTPADAFLPQETFLSALDHCEALIGEVLKSEPQNAKAFFRRGQLCMARGDLGRARAALDESKRLQGGDGGGVRAALAQLKESEQLARRRERELYAGGTCGSQRLAEGPQQSARLATCGSSGSMAQALTGGGSDKCPDSTSPVRALQPQPSLRAAVLLTSRCCLCSPFDGTARRRSPSAE